VSFRLNALSGIVDQYFQAAKALAAAPIPFNIKPLVINNWLSPSLITYFKR
jgi:hypothetical protein